MASAYYLSPELLSCTELTPNEKLVYSVLRTDSRVVSKTSRISNNQTPIRIAGKIACKSVRTVISALQRLEVLGAVKLENNGYLVFPYPPILSSSDSAPTEKEPPSHCEPPSNDGGAEVVGSATDNTMVDDMVLYIEDDEPAKKDHPWRGIKNLRELFLVLTEKGTNRDECAKGRVVLFNIVPDQFLAAVSSAIDSANKMTHSIDSLKRYSMKELVDATKSVEDHETYKVLADAYKTVTKG